MKNSIKRITKTLLFTKKDLFSAVITALLFSAFIYLAWFDIHSLWINSFLGLIAFYRLLKATQAQLLVSGFFIGLLWFYWIGFSFRYYDLTFFIPLVSIGFALAYLLFFWFIGFFNNPYIRVVLIFSLSFFEPLDFNWFKPELLFVESIFGVHMWQYALILLSLTLLTTLKRPLGYLSLLLLFGAINYDNTPNKLFSHSLSLVSSDIPQSEKWIPENRQKWVMKNIDYIEDAIDENKSLVILPESNIPLYLNQYPRLVEKLQEMSQSIDIIVGSLYAKDNLSYNATYFFSKGEMQIATKMVLVPFGEYLPLPKFLSDWFKEVVFHGADDYMTALEPSTFNVQGSRMRNAICYEASCELFYEDRPDFIVATSNNAWFTPSIQPTLQTLLIKLYAKRYHVTVLHSINGSKSVIIYPNDKGTP